MKNVILITIDSLRADHIGSLGYAKKLTPNLDEIAKNGVLFSQAFSYGSTTLTSIPPLLTSLPILSYYEYFITKKRINNLEEGLDVYKELVKEVFEINPTIAGVLKQYRYETAAFHSNPYLSRYYGYGNDFLHFDDSFDEYNFIKKIKEKIKIILTSRKIDSLAKHLYFYIYGDKIPYIPAKKINKKAISWLRKKNPKNFFLWLHYMDTHVPYMPQKDFRPDKISSLQISNLNRKLLSCENLSEGELSQIIELYDGCIKYVDYSIKSLFDELNNMKLLDDTIVIITADHGDEFKDHSGLLHTETKLYDELLHVPLIIYGTEYKNIIINELVSLIDIVPTVMEVLNINTKHKFQGRSLIPIINGEKNIGVMSQGMGQLDGNLKMIIAYRTRRWKCILDKMREKEELYDLKEDPKETKNLSTTKKDIAELIKSEILINLSHQHKLVASELEKEETKKKIEKIKKLKIN